MKFKTLVITKRIIIIFFVVLFLSVLLTLFALLKNNQTPVFTYTDEFHKQIISDALPNNQEKSVSVKYLVQKFFCVNFNSPETIIGEYYSGFLGTTPLSDASDIVEEIENTENQSDTVTDESTSSLPPIPDKLQICTAGDLKLNNATDYTVDLPKLCGEELAINTEVEEPIVLVMHTHTTECYEGDGTADNSERNTDEEKNVVAVGNIICDVLEENGIKTIHDKTYHDYPSYQGAYSRALSTIENRLAENPSIQIVLDIHRDAFVYSDGSRLAVTCEQNGISTAQVMLVVGTNSMGLKHDNWQENLKLATKIQNAAEIMYPGLMRPINLRTERFNEHLTNGSLIIEVGSNGNTLSQALEGGKNVATALSAVLNSK